MDAKVRGVSLEILTTTDCKSTELEHLVPNTCDLQQRIQLRGSKILAGAKDEPLDRARRQRQRKCIFYAVFFLPVEPRFFLPTVHRPKSMR